MLKKTNLFSNITVDLSSGLVVFLVALPLCLGIALASGAPLFSGIISGIVGGIIVGMISQSHISVSGPAAGLTAIVLTAITDLGAFNIFLLAVFLAGIFQLILGFIKAGSLSNYIPSNVIEGMLAGIGVIIFFKQLPYALGINSGLNNTSSPSELLSSIHYGSLLITIISVALLLSWDKIPFLKKIKLIPSALVVVIIGILINYFFVYTKSSLAISKDQLVTLPIPESIDELKSIFTSPNFSSITNPKVWSVAITIAIVASIETLLCIEAADRIDFQKRNTNTNIELIAQGTGNIVSSLLGGLPMTSVIVRTSANNNAGAQTKLSTIFHGLLLLVCAITIPWLLNKIPLATLASILLLIGYKLANPSVIKHFWLKGKYQFIPFIATLLAVVFMDLLKGVALGIVISIFFILKGNLKKAFTLRKDNNEVTHIDLAEEVSFLNKAEIKSTLNEIPENTKVIINAVDTVYITHDVLDILKKFQNIQSKNRNITVELINFRKEYQL
jgi:MFS superfamily sulfate permease-like transporter